MNLNKKNAVAAPGSTLKWLLWKESLKSPTLSHWISWMEFVEKNKRISTLEGKSFEWTASSINKEIDRMFPNLIVWLTEANKKSFRHVKLLAVKFSPCKIGSNWPWHKTSNWANSSIRFIIKFQCYRMSLVVLKTVIFTLSLLYNI